MKILTNRQGHVMAFILMLFIPLETLAYDFEVDGIYYQKTSSGECAVTYREIDAQLYSGDVVIPEEVSYDNQTYTVTSISDFAFCKSENLRTLFMPNTITSVGCSAFMYCRNLESVHISESITAISDYTFECCENLTSVDIPTSVTSIGKYSFWECLKLQSITIPDLVTTIGEEAFAGCDRMTVATIGKSVASIESNAFESCYGLGLVVCEGEVPPTISPYTFHWCNPMLLAENSAYTTAEYWKDLKKIIVKEDYVSSEVTFEVDGLKYEVNSIPSLNCNIYGISAEKSGDIVIPEHVTYKGREFEVCSIRPGFMYNRPDISSLSIPKTVTYIHDGAILSEHLKTLTVASKSFSADYCLLNTQVDSLIIKPSVEWMHTFLLHNTVDHLIIEDDESPLQFSFQNLGAADTKCNFKNIYIGRSLPYIRLISDIASLTSVTIGNKVKSLGGSVFSGCTGLSEVNVVDLSAWFSINFSDSLSNPLYYAHRLYQDNTEVTAVQIPTSVNEVNPYAFIGCSSLKSVTVPSSIVAMGEGAFSGCDNLERVHMSDLASWAQIKFGDYDANPLSQADHLYLQGAEIKQLTIPASISEIGDYTFVSCKGIENLVFEESDNQLKLGVGSFMNLKPAYINLNRVLSDVIGCDKSALETLVIGPRVKSIIGDEFGENDNIKTIICNNPVPPTMYCTFSNRTYLNGTLYVPDESIADYQTATAWKDFWEIKPMTEVPAGVGSVGAELTNGHIIIDSNTISVKGEKFVRIMSIGGHCIYSGRGNCNVAVPRGLYVVMTGKEAIKVVVK